MHKLTLFLLLSLYITASFAQTTFQQLYGNYDNAGNAIRQTSDGGYIIAGSTNITNDSNEHAYLIRTDVNGDTLWTKIYGGSGVDYAYDVKQTNDNGFILVGTTSSFGVGLDNIYLIKTDANGDTLWTKAYGGANDDEGYAVQQTFDNGYIITGSTMSFGDGVENVYLIKTDANGSLLWSRTFGGTQFDVGNDIQQTNDSGYIIVGKTDSYGAGGFDTYLIKTDAEGNMQWSNTYGGTSDDEGFAVQQTTDLGYIVTGYTASFGAGNYDVYLIKTNSAGAVEWTKAYGGPYDDEGYSVQQTKDGGYIVCGYTTSFGLGLSNVYLIKTDANGDTLWTTTYGGTGYDAGNSIQLTTDGGYIIGGTSDILTPQGVANIYLIKTDAEGNSNCNKDTTATIVTSFVATTSGAATIVSSGGVTSPTATITSGGATVTTLCTTVGINEVTKNNSAYIYPNPFTTSATLVVSTPSSPRFLLTIYDITGRIVRQSTIQNSVTTIDRKGLQDGMYFYKISEGAGMNVTGELVIQ